MIDRIQGPVEGVPFLSLQAEFESLREEWLARVAEIGDPSRG